MWHITFTKLTFSLPPVTTLCVRTAEVSKYNPKCRHYIQVVILTEPPLCWNPIQTWCIKLVLKSSVLFPLFSFGKKQPQSAVHRLFIHYQVRFVILHQKKSVQWALIIRNHLCEGSAEGTQIMSWSSVSLYVEQGRSDWYQTHECTFPLHRIRKRAKDLNYLQNWQFFILS